MTRAGHGERDALATAARIRAGSENFGGKRRQIGGSREAAVLGLPPRVHRTAAEQAERVRLEGEEHTAAARHVARRLMVDRHGCTGTGCVSGRHERDLAGLHLVLYALGLRPDPRVAARDEWGKPVRVKTGGEGLIRAA